MSHTCAKSIFQHLYNISIYLYNTCSFHDVQVEYYETKNETKWQCQLASSTVISTSHVMMYGTMNVLRSMFPSLVYKYVCSFIK